MTSQQFLLCDNSNATNFKSWASALSNFIRSAGWTNSSDTGQLNGAGAGNWAGVSTVPGSGAFYYEIFQPGDGLQTFYLKIEYGNGSAPTLRVSVGQTTNGAGTLTGLFMGPYIIAPSFTAPSTTTTYECDLSGDSGRISMLLWRNAPNNAPQVFAIQRSLNASGAPYGTSTTGYVTIWFAGANGGAYPIGMQQSLVFGVGAAPAFFNNYVASNSAATGWPILATFFASSQAFNGTIPCMFLQPGVGVFDYPCTVIGAANCNDLTEGVPFTITNQYGQTRTYIPTRAGLLAFAGAPDSGNHYRATILVEYD
jgi:hypothetical protein